MNWAHLHLMLIHVPVFGAFLVAGAAALIIISKDDALMRFALQFIILIGILTVPAYLTGEPAEEMIEHLPGVSEALINRHEGAAVYALILTEASALLACLSLWLRHRGSKQFNRTVGLLFLISLINIAAISWTANLGGQIRHPEVRGDTASAASGSQQRDGD
jgi:hypothetical protein